MQEPSAPSPDKGGIPPVNVPPPYSSGTNTTTGGPHSSEYHPPYSSPPEYGTPYSQHQGVTYTQPQGYSHPQTASYQANYSNAPPVPPGYPVGPPGQTVVVHSAPIYVTQNVFGEVPIQTTCPKCQSQVMTQIDYETGTLTWIVVATLFGLGFAIIVTWFCCCIPFCIDSLKDVVHKCPNCHTVIGKKTRLS